MQAQDWIEHLSLLPHPEGGYYKETYRRDGFMAVEENAMQQRNYCTAIYFLLLDGNFSAFHRIKSDEVWHHYDGLPLELFEIGPTGILHRTLIGKDAKSGHVPQHVVPAGHWFASRVLGGKGFTLVGCTVSPGFDFADFELADRERLRQLYPHHAEIIQTLTR